MKQCTTLIIGGGVIGLSTAYHLARRSHGRVILLEKDRIGDGSSVRAAGISTGLLWSEIGVQARKISLRLFREYAQEFPNYSFHQTAGCLNLFSPELWQGRAELLPLYDRLGAPYRVLDAAAIRLQWPDFHPHDSYIGLHDPLGGYSEAPEYVAALTQRVRELGVEIREGTRVTDFVLHGSQIEGVKLADGAVIGADAVVCTVHAWTLPVLEPLRLQLPVKHFVHQRYLSRPVNHPWHFPPTNADIFGGYVRPAAGNRLLLGVETADREEWRVTSPNFRMSELGAPSGLRETTVDRFGDFLPALRELSWETEEVGLISFSMDGEPILGPVGSIPGLFLGLAFHSGGFSYNPVAGMLLAEFVAEGHTSLDVSSFSPDRFAASAISAHLNSTVRQGQAVRRRH